MENRKQAILRAVVHEFTTSAVPVGSQALQSRYFVNLSSATIRSELAELADLGYLAQPHTSAGRVPTDSGYRYFVDFLMDVEPVPERVHAFINDEMRAAPADVEGMVERVAMTVAAVTQNASVASAPQGALAGIKHVDLVSLEPKEVLLILLLEGNLLRQQVVNTTEAATQAQLTKLAARFNESLAAPPLRRRAARTREGAARSRDRGPRPLRKGVGEPRGARWSEEPASPARVRGVVSPAPGPRGARGNAVPDRAAATAHRRVRPPDRDRVGEHVEPAARLRGGSHLLRAN